MFQLAKINKQNTETRQDGKENEQPKNTDLSVYVISYTWSGDVEQAGRKLEFDIAYTTKDKDWTNAVLELGDEVQFSFLDDKTQETFPVFRGRIFSRSRDSESYTMRFVAFDNIIYLAKSRITRKYTNVTVADAIRQTIHDFSIEAGTMPDLSVVCSFIADDISATDAIKQALSYQSAQDGKGYHIYMTDGKLNVVCTNDQVVENFLISDETNLTGASVSESIEDMVSKVVVVDSTGQMILQRRAHPLKKRPASSKKAGRKRWWDSSLPVMRPWRPFPIWTDGKEFKLIGSLSSRYAFTHVALELDFFKTGPFR